MSDCVFNSSQRDALIQEIEGVQLYNDTLREYIDSKITSNNDVLESHLQTYINMRCTQIENAISNASNSIQDNQYTAGYAMAGYTLQTCYFQTLFFLNFIILSLKFIDNIFKFNRGSEDTVYVELELNCVGYETSFVLGTPIVGSNSSKAIASIISTDFIVNDPLPTGISGFTIKSYICIGSSNFNKSVMELLLKNLFLLKSVSFKQDADLKQTHSKGFLQFLLNKLKDNFESFVSQLGLSESVSNAQTELELPSSANSALTLYTSGVSTFDWLTDLLNLFVDFVNSLVDYSQTSKIDRILECEFDSKKFNRLLGDALNYATNGEVDPENPDRLNEPVVERCDQTYIDLNPDGQVSLDWDGGLPASVSHRHYNFKKFLCFLRDTDGNKFFTSEEFKRLFKQFFIPGEEI